MDAKLYIVWREILGKWAVEYHDEILSKHDTKDEAVAWKQSHYPNHGHETERVVVRVNSPKGAKRGQWL
jgi:hypothetical protein